MAETELDSFLTKFKSMWASVQEANLTLNSKKVKVWAAMPSASSSRSWPGRRECQSARQRRKIRRAAAGAHVVTEEVTEVATEADEVDECNKDAEKDTPQNVTGASVQEVANTKELANDSTEKRNISISLYKSVNSLLSSAGRGREKNLKVIVMG